MQDSVTALALKIANSLPSIRRKRDGNVHSFLVAAVLMLPAFLLCLKLAPLPAGLHYAAFFPAIAIAAIYGGFSSGLFATILGYGLATGLFSSPYFHATQKAMRIDLWPSMIFLAGGIIVTLAIEVLHRDRQRDLDAIQASEARTWRVIQELGDAIAMRDEIEAELRIAAVAFDSDEAIMITDATANIIRVNRAFEKITGYRQEEVVGKNPSMFRSGRHDREFYTRMWQELLRKGSWSGELWDKHKNGNIYPKQSTITAVKDAHGLTTHYVSIFTDISDRKNVEAEIYNLAFNDALTGLPNRRLLNDRLTQAMAACKRSGRYGALLFMDLDNFKPLNDTHGHDMGDLLLIEVAERLKRCMRETDTVARFGGDEFVVVLNELDMDKSESLAQALLIVEKIRTVLSEPYRLVMKEGSKAGSTVLHQCSASIGLTLFSNHEERAEDIIKWADIAMYRAKKEGRNAVHLHDEMS